MFHELTDIGYKKLHKDISFGYYMNHNSMRRNMQVIRKLLGKWGRSNIVLGDLDAWKAAAADCNLEPLVQDTVLWMDSSDFKV